MTIRIPDKNRRVLQTNRSTILGNLWSSFNLDLQSNLGVIRVGKRMKFNSSPSGLGLPVGFTFFDGRIFTIAGTQVFANTGLDLTSAFVADSSSGAITTYDSGYSDLIIFNGVLATLNGGTQHLYTKATNGSGTGAWTDRGAWGVSNTLKKYGYFKKFDRLYAGGGQTMVSSDTSYNLATSGDYSLTLSATPSNSGFITTFICSNDRIWIGTNHGSSAGDTFDQCSIFDWDGISSTVTNEYRIPANGIMAITLQNGIPVALDSNGILRKFDGTGFPEIGRLPLRKEQTLGFTTNTGNDNRFIHPNGLIWTENDTFLALIANPLDYSTAPYEIRENLPSGIWEWSKDSNFVHKQPITYMPIGTTTVTDYGQNIIAEVGGLNIIKIPTNAAKGILICGAQYYTDALTTKFAVLSEAPYPNTGETKFGYLVTTFMLSSGLADAWDRVFAKYRQFLNATDKIIVKFRTTEQAPVQINITWASTTTFTTSTDITAYIPSSTNPSGYEVEILQGTGGGKCAHIVSVVNNSGTFTATLDETFTGVTSGTAIARIQNWIKFGSVNEQTSEYKIFTLGQNKFRVQIKVCMQFTDDDELFELNVLNNKFQPLA